MDKPVKVYSCVQSAGEYDRDVFYRIGQEVFLFLGFHERFSDRAGCLRNVVTGERVDAVECEGEDKHITGPLNAMEVLAWMASR